MNNVIIFCVIYRNHAFFDAQIFNVIAKLLSKGKICEGR